MTSLSRRTGAVVVASSLALSGALVALAAPASASASANELAYTYDNGIDDSVAVRDLTSGKVVLALPAVETDTGDIAYGEPEISPDGSKLVVAQSDSSDASSSAAVDSGLLVYDRATKKKVLVLPDSFTGSGTSGTYCTAIDPTFSPDGTTVLATSVCITETDPNAQPTIATSLVSSPSDHSAPTTLAGSSGDAFASYDPTGTRIAFSAVDFTAETFELETRVLSSGTTTDLMTQGAEARWSPDGATLAFSQPVSTDPSDPSTTLATIPSGGGTATVLPATKVPAGHATGADSPSWTPDGRAIFYDRDVYEPASSDSAGNTDSQAYWSVDANGVRAGQLFAVDTDVDQASRVQGPAPAPATAGKASLFTPAAPVRLLDTRKTAAVGPLGSVAVQVTGAKTGDGTVVPSDITAVVLNVTAVDGTTLTNVRAYPSGSAVPVTSNLNTTAAKQVVANQVTVPVGPDGKVVLRNASGSVQLLADLTGYYTPTTDALGSGYQPTSPARILDTRNARIGRAGGKVAQAPRDLQVTGTVTTDTGTVTVPATATAVVLNVTGTTVPVMTNLRVFPTPVSGNAVPTVSSLNLAKGQTAPNLVTVKVGAGGKVRFFNAAKSIDVVADLQGWYDASAPGQFVPAAPLRTLDTRAAAGGPAVPLGASQALDLPVAGFRGVPSSIVAVALNLTATGVTGATSVRAYPTPTDSTVPSVSNLNLVKGDTRANAAIVQTGQGGDVRLRNGAGSVQLLADLAGWFINPA